MCGIKDIIQVQCLLAGKIKSLGIKKTERGLGGRPNSKQPVASAEISWKYFLMAPVRALSVFRYDSNWPGCEDVQMAVVCVAIRARRGPNRPGGG